MENLYQPEVWQVAHIYNSDGEMLLDMSDCQEICYFMKKFNWPRYEIIQNRCEPENPKNYPGIILHDLTQEMYDYWDKELFGYSVVKDNSDTCTYFVLHEDVKNSVISLNEIWENASKIYDLDSREEAYHDLFYSNN